MVIQQNIDANRVHLIPPAPGSVRVGVLSAIPALLQIHGSRAAARIFAEVGIEQGLLDYPENSISFALAGELLESCALNTDLPHFGILLGRGIKPEDIGQYAELSVYAPDVVSALRSMILHICVHDRGGAPTLTSDHGIVRLGYAIYEPLRVGAKHINNVSLSIMCNLMRSMCGELWTPLEVHFSHSPPLDITNYETFFCAPLQFDSDMDALIFPDRWLEKPISSADKEHFNFLLKQFSLIEGDMEINLEEKIRSIIRPLIISPRCTHKNIASMLAMHPRTLNRKLEDRGTTLRNIVGDIRFEIAKQMLVESKKSITEISTIIGYADSSTLVRSFQRWTGRTPSEWRKQNVMEYGKN